MPNGGVRITLPMLAERMNSIQAGIDQIQKDLRAVNEQALDRRVSNLENTVRWLSRTLAGALISGIGAVIVAVVLAR